MKPEEDPLEEFLANLPPMSDDEKAGMLVTMFSSLIETYDRETLINLRTYFWLKPAPLAEKTTILQVLDGEIALRGISDR